MVARSENLFWGGERIYRANKKRRMGACDARRESGEDNGYSKEYTPLFVSYMTIPPLALPSSGSTVDDNVVILSAWSLPSSRAFYDYVLHE